jgi:hypothetical protein
MALGTICRRCNFQPAPYPSNLFERFGDDGPAIDLRHHLRCGSYRGRMANPARIRPFKRQENRARAAFKTAPAMRRAEEGVPALGLRGGTRGHALYIVITASADESRLDNIFVSCC